MKIVAVACNIVVVVFTCFVLVTDGVSREAAYLAFTPLLLLAPILSSVVISCTGANDGWLFPRWKGKAGGDQGEIEGTSSAGTSMNSVAIVCNILLLGFVCWAIVDQYPHPAEEGVIPFAVLAVLTPVLNVAAIVRGCGAGSRGHHPGGKVPERSQDSDDPPENYDIQQIRTAKRSLQSPVR